MEKRVQDYTQEILDTIRSNSSPAVMGSRLEDYHENDLADVLPLCCPIFLSMLNPTT